MAKGRSERGCQPQRANKRGRLVCPFNLRGREGGCLKRTEKERKSRRVSTRGRVVTSRVPRRNAGGRKETSTRQKTKNAAGSTKRKVAGNNSDKTRDIKKKKDKKDPGSCNESTEVQRHRSIGNQTKSGKHFL